MLEPDAIKDVSDDRINEVLLDRPISSLRDLQYTYGALAALVEEDKGEYNRYYTPEEAGVLEGKERGLLVLRVDATEEDPSFEGVRFQQYSNDMIDEIGHSYNKSGWKSESITFRTGNTSIVPKHALRRFTEWTQKEATQRVAEEHPDGDLIHKLAALGDEAESEIKEAVEKRVDGEHRCLITVEITRDGGETWRYPGEIEVLNEGMRANNLREYEIKSSKSIETLGEGVGYVSGEETEVVGNAPTPLNHFVLSNTGNLPDFDANESWRSQPIKRDVAEAIDSSDPLIDSCSIYIKELGVSVYLIPYFTGEMTVDQAKLLYRVLTTNESEDREETNIEKLYEKREKVETESNKLRFYTTVALEERNSFYHIFYDEMGASPHTPFEIGMTHQQVLESGLFGEDKTSGFPFETVDTGSYPLLNPDRHFIRRVTTGTYFSPTLPDRKSSPDSDGSIDDSRIQLFVDSIGGSPVSVDTLIPEYVERLCNEEGDSFPSRKVQEQFSQLVTLATCGLLDATDEKYSPFEEPPEYMTDEDKSVQAENREEKLQKFIDSHPPLRNDKKRRGAFLTGALIGHISRYQVSDGKSHTIVDDFSVSAMTKHRLKKAVTTALDKNLIYSSKEEYVGTMFREVVDELRDCIIESDVREWTLKPEDIRFFYALGVSYGKNHPSKSSVKTEETNKTVK